MWLVGSYADGVRKVLRREFHLPHAQAQFATILVCLPQLRALPDRLSEEHHRAIGAAVRGELVGLVVQAVAGSGLVMCRRLRTWK